MCIRDRTTAENKAIAQKEILTKVEQKVDSVYNDYKSLIDRQIFMQERIEENANSAGVLLNEGSLIFSIRLMESENMMDPAEIAELCYFLAGPKSSSVTGAIIDAYGASNPLFHNQ